MQYISPLSLTGTLEDSALDKKSLLLAKKKMLAELELTGNDSVTVNGRELTKNDILVFFDTLQQSTDLTYHVAIANDPVLLNFLEKNELQFGDWFKKEEMYKDPAFLEWISPYYYESFTRLGYNSLTILDENVWITLFANPILLTSYYQDQAWDYFEKELLVDMGRLEEAEKAEEEIDENLVSLLCDIRYVKMMRKLPAERFSNFWDHYAYIMMNAAVRIFMKGMRNMALVYIDNAMTLVYSQDVKDAVAKKEAEMKLVIGRTAGGSSSDGGTSNWSTIRIIITVLIIVIKAATCASNSHSAPLVNKLQVYITDTTHQKQQVNKAPGQQNHF